MKKILSYCLVNLFTWNPDKSMDIVREFLCDNPEVKSDKQKRATSIVNKEKKVHPKSKKDELLESLNYLKSKEFKTKQDKESIYTLEVILKNMS